MQDQAAGYLQVAMHNEGGVWTALVGKLPKKGILYAYCVEGPGGWDTGYRWVNMQRMEHGHQECVQQRAACACAAHSSIASSAADGHPHQLSQCIRWATAALCMCKP